MFITNINLMNSSTIVSFVWIQNVHRLCYCYHVIWEEKDDEVEKSWHHLLLLLLVHLFVKEKTNWNFVLNLPNKHQNLEVKGMKEMASKTIVHNPKPIHLFIFSAFKDFNFIKIWYIITISFFKKMIIVIFKKLTPNTNLNYNLFFQHIVCT